MRTGGWKEDDVLASQSVTVCMYFYVYTPIQNVTHFLLTVEARSLNSLWIFLFLRWPRKRMADVKDDVAEWF